MFEIEITCGDAFVTVEFMGCMHLGFPSVTPLRVSQASGPVTVTIPWANHELSQAPYDEAAEATQAHRPVAVESPGFDGHPMHNQVPDESYVTQELRAIGDGQ